MQDKARTTKGQLITAKIEVEATFEKAEELKIKSYALQN